MEKTENSKTWIIRASYPHGGHTVMWNDAPLRFTSRQDASTRAEVLNSKTRDTGTHYIVVEEGI